MKHYREKLSAYLHRELAEDARREIDAHLRICAGCRAELNEITFGAQLADSLAQRDAPPEVWKKIEESINSQAAIAAADERSARKGFFRQPFLIPAAAAALVCAAVFSIFLYLRSSDSLQKTANPPQNQQIQTNETGAWSVEAISGAPKTENRTIGEKGVLAVGETLETDAAARATVKVADIGHVEIAPNSRVQLVKTGADEHRLSLEKGVIEAQIFAPPRLFVVDTPSAAAVDLGCAYTLEVDDAGNSKIHVTGGFVALERDGRESIVPAGAIALTKKGRNLGTPFADDASVEFRDALYRFDFENGGRESLKTLLANPNIKTSVTLWHLLSRVSESDRPKVFERLVSVVPLPEGVSRRGILALDRDMLNIWRFEIEGKWFEKFYGPELKG